MKKLLFVLVFLFLPVIAVAVDVRGPDYEDYPGWGTDTRAAYEAPNGIGMICIVTDRTNDNSTLGDSTRNGIAVKTGSLRECINGNPGAGYGKIIMFEVSGIIESSGTNTHYDMDDDYTTVWGQTAPCSGDDCGVILKNIQVTMGGSHQLIQHIRIRATDDYDSGIDADYFSCLEGGSGTHQIVDHVSASWAPDSIFGFAAYGDNWTDSTFSYNSVTMGIAASLHSESPHSKGFSITGVDSTGNMDNISVIGNFIGHSDDRNPNLAIEGDIDFLNNIQYNHGNVNFGPTYFFLDAQATPPATLDYIGNYTKKGPDSSNINESIDLVEATCSDYTAYIADNVCYAYSSDYSTADPGGSSWGACVEDDNNCEATSKVTSAINLPSGYTPYSALTVPSIAFSTTGLRAVGAWPAYRDAVDTCLIDQFDATTGDCGSTGNERGCVPDDEDDNCALGSFANGSHTLSLPSNPHVVQASGYTILEEWVHINYTALAEGRTISFGTPPVGSGNITYDSTGSGKMTIDSAGSGKVTR